MYLKLCQNHYQNLKPLIINVTYLEKSELVSIDWQKRSNVCAAGIRIVVTRKGFVVSSSDL